MLCWDVYIHAFLFLTASRGRPAANLLRLNIASPHLYLGETTRSGWLQMSTIHHATMYGARRATMQSYSAWSGMQLIGKAHHRVIRLVV
jgi:hypothetical protein